MDKEYYTCWIYAQFRKINVSKDEFRKNLNI